MVSLASIRTPFDPILAGRYREPGLCEALLRILPAPFGRREKLRWLLVLFRLSRRERVSSHLTGLTDSRLDQSSLHQPPSLTHACLAKLVPLSWNFRDSSIPSASKLPLWPLGLGFACNSGVNQSQQAIPSRPMRDFLRDNVSHGLCKSSL
ncbi:hypothetical protein BGZ61DRAFT_452355 [Ilyonectria robusta]|uniref:uncharacterized protein n=1 Tax=Ilyonectria robusta TaxID=1079257 RepID=UPI001E8EB2FE|nr:uncharacterized protein BGZ61DRAFT_452355 [Ilyonectria robusta]KAH8694698.1 hypothetical protein BGZ61DRAFT_452355 [Ilyonectria robusta]